MNEEKKTPKEPVKIDASEFTEKPPPKDGFIKKFSYIPLKPPTNMIPPSERNKDDK